MNITRHLLKSKSLLNLPVVLCMSYGAIAHAQSATSPAAKDAKEGSNLSDAAPQLAEKKFLDAIEKLETADELGKKEVDRLNQERKSDALGVEKLAKEAEEQSKRIGERVPTQSENMIDAHASQADPKKSLILPPTGTEPLPTLPAQVEQFEREKGKLTVITCDGAALYDSEKGLAVFHDNVRVENPDFRMTADVMEVYLDNEKEKKPANNASGAEEETSNIKLIIAKGKEVFIEKVTPNGELQIGRSRHATFDAKTKEMILRDWPQVQRGASLMKALDAKARIIMKESGEIKGVDGKTETRIVPKNND